MPNYDPVLTSAEKTADTENKTRLLASAAQSRAEIWRLNKILFPEQTHDASSITTWDPDAPQKARIGLLKTTLTSAAMTAPVDNTDQVARKKIAMDAALAGKPIETPTTIRDQLASEETKLWATLDAIDFLTAKIERENQRLAVEYAKKTKSRHDVLTKSVCQKALELHTALSELHGLKMHFIDNSIDFNGLFGTVPDFLGTPNNPNSDLAGFLRAAKNDGMISAVPRELRL
jgi:hypothetical protein